MFASTKVRLAEECKRSPPFPFSDGNFSLTMIDSFHCAVVTLRVISTSRQILNVNGSSFCD